MARVRFYIYHIPNFSKNGTDPMKYKKVASSESYEEARMKAIRFIGKSSKVCALVRNGLDGGFRNIDYIVEYQDGSRFYKDGKAITRHTGYVFNYVSSPGYSTFMLNGQGTEIARRKVRR